MVVDPSLLLPDIIGSSNVVIAVDDGMVDVSFASLLLLFPLLFATSLLTKQSVQFNSNANLRKWYDTNALDCRSLYSSTPLLVVELEVDDGTIAANINAILLLSTLLSPLSTVVTPSLICALPKVECCNDFIEVVYDDADVVAVVAAVFEDMSLNSTSLLLQSIV